MSEHFHWQKVYDLACTTEGVPDEVTAYLGALDDLFSAIDGARSRALNSPGGVTITRQDWADLMAAWKRLA